MADKLKWDRVSARRRAQRMGVERFDHSEIGECERRDLSDNNEKLFNRRYRELRLAAKAEGRAFMTYAEAKRDPNKLLLIG
ncbi:MAG: hypothetical protein J2P55_00260 [Rhizobiales bacterium]|nr:hypothetical protein [Hyphomicrobiales bacterium]